MFDFLSSSDDKQREEVEIGLSEFEDWLEDRIRDGETVGPEQKSEEIESIISRTKDSLRRLEQASVPEEMDPRLESAGKTNKEVLIKRLRGFVDNFDLPDGGTEDTVEFLRKKSRSMDELSDQLQRNFMFIQKIHEDESKQVLDSVRRLEDELEVDGGMEQAYGILESYSELSDLIEEKQTIEEDIGKLEEQLETKGSRKEELSERIEEIEESGLKKKKEELKGELSSVGNKINRERNGLIQRISPLGRGLRKLEYYGTAPGDREDLLKEYIDSIPEAVKQDEDLEYLGKLVDKLRELLGSEGLDFDSSEREKLGRDLDKVDLQDIKDRKGRLEKLLDRKSSLESEMEELEKEDRKKSAESKLGKQEEEIRNITEKIDSKTDRIKELEDMIKKEKQELESKVGELFDIDLSLSLE